MHKYIVIMILLIVAGFVQPSPGASWAIDQVTYNSMSQTKPYVTIVQNAFTMIAYNQSEGDSSMICTGGNMPGDWVTFRITFNPYKNVATDITSKYSQMMIHIAIWWQNPPYQGISYCKGNPAGWPIQQVTGKTEDASWPSVEVDSKVFAHIAYQKNTGGDQEIFYSNNVSGPWTSEQVTDNASNDIYPCLALDGAGSPYIVFSDGSALYYVKKASGVWSTPELIASGVDSTTHPYMVLDAQNKAYVCFTKSDGTDEEIYYVTNRSGSWSEKKITDNAYDDLYPTIAVDLNRTVHIAYTADEPGDAELYYANNTSGTWVIEKVTDNDVDDNTYYGRYFILDLLGRGHIFFWNDLNGNSEIYHARSKDPLFVGVEETTPAIPPASIKVASNPSLATSTISYSVPATGNVSLRVYDVSGGLVKTLVEGVQQQGLYSVTWDGGTNTGVHAAPGVYFYRLSANGQNTSVKGILK